MKIAFNPSTVAALTSPPNNKDITFDLKGHNIFARGVKFYGTDTNTWRDIKVNNVSIGSNILDLRNGSNTTLTNTNGVVTINSTWRPVVDSLTSDSTTSSLSAKQGKVLKALIDGKSDSDHNHDDRYVRAFGITNDNIDSDWGQSFKTFDPIPSGTPPEQNPNISLLSICGYFNRRKQLAFMYNNDNIYYRRHVDGVFTNWRRLAFANEIPDSLKNPYALTISLNGTSQGPYDGSAAKSINITPGSIGAATNDHNHDERYLALSGGWMSGNINFGGNNRIAWMRNTDSASISFKNDGDADSDSYMSFVTSDNGNEYFRWSHSSGSTNTEWMSLRGDGLRIGGTKVSLEGHTHDDRYLKLSGGTMQLGEGLKFHADENYFGTYADARIISLLDGNGIICDGGLIIDERATLNGKEYVTELLRIRDSEFKWRGADILHSGNYSGILDSRYYTESEVNSLLSTKLDRVNLSTGGWNPRGYNLAADYCYNGGDLSISESGGQIHVSVDGYFWQNEGQYRVLDVSDIAGIRGSISVQQYLSNTDINWYPLVWGGDDHRNTYTSTGAVYKSHDVLSWQTSSQTLYATRLATNSIDLQNNRGIYQVTSKGTSPYRGIQLPDLQSNGLGIFSRVGNGSDEGGIIISEDTSVIYNSFDTGWGLSVRDKDLYQTNISGEDTIAFGVRQDHRAYSLGGFEKSGSSNSYVLLGGGDHKLESALSVANADKLDGYHANTSQAPFGLIPTVGGDGVMEIGKYIDFHNDNGGKYDYSTRLQSTGNYQNTISLPSGSGTLALTSQIPNKNSWNYDDRYLKLTGGTMTGIIKATNRGGSWISGRDHCLIRSDDKTSTSYWTAILAIATVNGYWTLGHLGDGGERIGFNYDTDADYKAGNNNSHVVWLPTGGTSGTLALTTDNVASASKLQTARKIWGQSFDGTADISGTLSGVANIQFSADNAYDIGSNSNASRYIYTYWLGAKEGQKLELGANNSNFGHGLCINTNLNVGIGTNTPGYKLQVNGDQYATGWSRANNGFYCEGAGVHFSHNGSVGEIAMTSNNELTWGSSTSELYFNYREISRGHTVTSYIWNAGSNTSWAKHSLGALDLHGDVYWTNGDATMKIYGVDTCCGKENVAFQSTFDGQNPLTSTYVTKYRTRSAILLQPRGGNVGINVSHDPSYTLTVGGDIYSSGQIVREGSSQAWVNGRVGALLRETSVAGYHTLWSLKTTDGSWDFGEYNAGSGWNNVPVMSYVTDSDYASGNNTTTYQIRFPLDSGTVALTKNIPSSLPANGGNADTVDGVHMDWSSNYTDGNYLAIWDNAGNCIRPIPKGSVSVGYASSADRTRALKYTGTGNYEITAYQTADSYMGRSGWASYIICNHGDGSTYYSQTIAMPFWGSPIYRRLEGGTDRGWKKFYTEENPPSWDNITNKPSTFTPSSHTHTWTSITDKIVAGNEFNIVNAGFKSGMWFNYLPINNRDSTATVQGYHFGNGAKGYTSVIASGFVKNGSSSSYVLLGDGGHQTISSLSVNYASNAGNASTLGGTSLGGLFTAFGNNAHNITATIGGVTKSFLVNYAADADKVDGVHVKWAGELTSTSHLVAWESDGSALRDINPANVTVGSANYASSAGNADTVDGYHASQLAKAWSGASITMNYVAQNNGNYFGMITGTGTDGFPNNDGGWTHVFQSSYNNNSGGDGNTGNFWVTQIANRAGTTSPWIRSRSGGSSISTGWTSWVRIMTKNDVDNYYWANNKITTSPKIDAQVRVSSLGAGCLTGIANTVMATNWLRATGNTGIYFQDYAGGLYMSDDIWIRTYNNKAIMATGYAHSRHNSDDAVLLAGGGYAQGVPVKYYGMYSVSITSGAGIATQKAGNFKFVTDSKWNSLGVAKFTCTYPQGYNIDNTFIWAQGNNLVGTTVPVQASVLEGASSTIFIHLTTGDNPVSGYCKLYFICF